MADNGVETSPTVKTQAAEKTTRLSYNDQRELGGLPAKIEKLELRLSQLQEQMSAPGFYQSDYEQVQGVTRELAEVQANLDAAYERWDELE